MTDGAFFCIKLFPVDVQAHILDYIQIYLRRAGRAWDKPPFSVRLSMVSQYVESEEG